MIELNIGLNVGSNRDGERLHTRRVMAESVCMVLFGGAQLKLRTAVYRAEGGRDVRELTLVVLAPDAHPSPVLRRQLDRLAALLGQDYIALLHVTDDVGDDDTTGCVLVGPRTEKWGSFPIETFIRFDD